MQKLVALEGTLNDGLTVKMSSKIWYFEMKTPNLQIKAKMRDLYSYGIVDVSRRTILKKNIIGEI